jgi:glutathione S-transferase
MRRQKTLKAIVEPRAARANCGPEFRHAEPLVNANKHGPRPRRFCRLARDSLDGQLKGRKFVTGDTLTLADFSLGAAMILADMGQYPVAPYGEIKRWYANLSALPAWQTTLARAAMPA